MKPTELRTGRLILRPFRASDANDVLAYASDEEWSRYLEETPEPYTRDDAVEFVDREKTRDWKQNAVFAIEHNGSVIGGLNLIVNLPNQTAELGYGMGSKHWGQGIAHEAISALLAWAFPAYDFVRIFARVDTRNERSWRLLERLGLTREGHLRSVTLTHRGERRDEFVYGLLREEWESR